MSTVAIKNTMVMNNTEKKASLVERFKKYGIAEEPKFERYSEEYSYND